ncbi:MAG: type II secretion system major pseudopilin GspG [Pirellulaceae bacterium]|jgi:general secretion pathway protein G
MKRRNPTRQGLTLIELMIVLVILVGLMAIVGPRVLGTQRKADIRTAQAQIGSINSALKMYAVDMKTYPSTEEGLALLVESPEDERLAKNWDGPYLDGNLPVDPWGNEFQYEFGDEESEDAPDFPLVYSLGPDGQPNSSDDVGNVSKEDAGGDEGSSKGSSSRSRRSTKE